MRRYDWDIGGWVMIGLLIVAAIMVLASVVGRVLMAVGLV